MRRGRTVVFFALFLVVLAAACGSTTTTDTQVFSQSGSVQAFNAGTGQLSDGHAYTDAWSIGYPSWTVTLQCYGVGDAYPLTFDVVTEPAGPIIKHEMVSCPQNSPQTFTYDLQGTGSFSANLTESAGTVQWTVTVISELRP